MKRDEIPGFVGALLGYPTQWAVPPLVAWDGAGSTLEVLDVPLAEQVNKLSLLHPHRESLESAAGGPLVILFRKSSRRGMRGP